MRPRKVPRIDRNSPIQNFGDSAPIPGVIVKFTQQQGATTNVIEITLRSSPVADVVISPNGSHVHLFFEPETITIPRLEWASTYYLRPGLHFLDQHPAPPNGEYQIYIATSSQDIRYNSKRETDFAGFYINQNVRVARECKLPFLTEQQLGSV